MGQICNSVLRGKLDFLQQSYLLLKHKQELVKAEAEKIG